MKNYQKLGCLLLAMLMLLVLAGCGAKDEWEAAAKMADKLGNLAEDTQLRADTEKLLNALIADDYQSAWGAICQEMDEAEFRNVYGEIQPLLNGVTQYELIPSNINKAVRNGVAFVSVRYMMTAGQRRVFVDVSRTEGYQGLTAFRLTDYIPVVTTGTLGNMQGADGIQWVLLIIGLLEWVFTICAFVDCCRHKVRRKWLWLLLVALGQVQISLLLTPTQMQTGIRAGIYLTYTNLTRYSTGGFLLLVMIPVGAVVYLCIRKKLFARYEAYMQQKAAQELPPEEIPAETVELPQEQQEGK